MYVVVEIFLDNDRSPTYRWKKVRQGTKFFLPVEMEQEMRSCQKRKEDGRDRWNRLSNNHRFLAWDLEVTMRRFSLPPCSIVLGISQKEWPPLTMATEEVLSSRKSRVSVKRRGDSIPFRERGFCQQWTVEFWGYYVRSWEKEREGMNTGGGGCSRWTEEFKY